jgi:DNA polymerase bacteriophage-type
LIQLLRGQQFRVGVGITTVLPDFDFETYSEGGLLWDAVEGKWTPLPGLAGAQKGLKGCGTRNYVCHPSFRILSLAWDLKDGRGARWWRPPELEDLFPVTRSGHLCDVGELIDYIATYRPGQDPQDTQGLIEAFNTEFEWQVWEYHCARVLGWHPLLLEQLRCCQAKAKASAHPPNLAAVGEVLQLTEQKDAGGKALITKLTMPKKPTKKDPAFRWTPQTAPEDFQRFYQYNIQDIKTEAAASLKLPDLTPRELRVWKMDQRVNMRGMQVDRGAIDDCICIVEQAQAREWGRLRQITNGHVQKHTEVQPTLKWMALYGVHLFNLDEETVEEELKKLHPIAVLEVLKIRQELSFGSVAKLFKFRAQATEEGRLYSQYSYYGAHTGLWNGHNVQVANLYKGIFDKPAKAALARAAIATRSLETLEAMFPGNSALEIIASYLRSLVIAAPGHRLISADFTAIQAVVTSALAGEEWRLKVFRENGPLYLEMASRLTGNPVQFYLDYKDREKKHHKDRQDFGKLPVLSGDFGAWIGGWKRFGADKILGSDDNIKAAILKTRAAQPMISELWGGQTRNKFNKAPDGSYAPERDELYGLEGAAIAAVLNPGKAFSHRQVTYQMHEDVLYCVGPSGAGLRYHSPRLERSTREYARPWELELSYEGWNTNAGKGRQNSWARMKLYGGVLTQNIVAHEAREIQADALLALDEHPSGLYPVVMHTHDENVVEVPYGRGSVAEYMQIIRGAIPSWAKTPDGRPWPINIPDAWECDFYGKWED